MSIEMKIAIWRLIIDHIPGGERVTATRVERLRQYKFRLLVWLDTGGIGSVPEPLTDRKYPFHWSLHKKITNEIANHRHDRSANVATLRPRKIPDPALGSGAFLMHRRSGSWRISGKSC